MFPDRSRAAQVAIALAVFVCVVALPAGYMFAQSVVGPDGLSTDAYRAVVFDARQRQLLFNTVRLGIGSAVLAASIGVPLGLALARVPLRGVGAIRLLLVAPLAIPPYILALAWSYLTRDYSLAGATIVLGAGFFPLVMLATEAAARGVGTRVEEAALMCAPPGRVFARITAPLMRPVVSAAVLLVFVLAISEFGVPGLLRVRVFTTEVFTAFAALYDFRRATALAAPLVLLCAAAATAAAVSAHAGTLAYRTGQRGGLQVLGQRWRRIVLGAVALTAILTAAVPVLVLATEAAAARGVTRYAQAAAPAAVNSIVLSAVAALLAVLLGLFVGYWRARLLRRGHTIVDAVLVTLFAVPSTVVGVGIIVVWNREWLAALYGTSAMIVVGALARFAPVAALLLAAAVRQLPAAAEETAAVSGARWTRVLTAVVVPQLWPAIAAAWLVVFILTFGEVGTTILVAPAGESTLPVRIYTTIANAPASHVAWLALAQVATVLLPLAVVALRLSFGSATVNR